MSISVIGLIAIPGGNHRKKQGGSLEQADWYVPCYSIENLKT